jgi:2,3-bisphosphoglycerate-dependent phosphoglycerate mutase
MESNSTKRIYLIRHCKADGQQHGAKLTGEGFEQAYRLTDFLSTKHIDHIISSTYERAIATITPLAQKINLIVNTDPRLCERILSSEVLENWEEKLKETFLDREMRLPGGETSFEAMERGISVLEDLFQQSANNIAVVTHGNIMCLMLRFYDKKYGFDEWRQLTNPDVYELLITNKGEEVCIKRIWEQH